MVLLLDGNLRKSWLGAKQRHSLNYEGNADLKFVIARFVSVKLSLERKRKTWVRGRDGERGREQRGRRDPLRP